MSEHTADYDAPDEILMDRLAASLTDRTHDWLHSTSESYAGEVGSERWVAGLVSYLIEGPGALRQVLTRVTPPGVDQ